ncbi:MAG: hypothetical protein QNJ46_32375 [Leptolyngbyaceae cyanobacterium MO_188.B28]|nr:hypothetical protein [Leptolyngbyaceae cyanobacterium MO_188.B28]
MGEQDCVWRGAIGWATKSPDPWVFEKPRDLSTGLEDLGRLDRPWSSGVVFVAIALCLKTD